MTLLKRLMIILVITLIVTSIIIFSVNRFSEPRKYETIKINNHTVTKVLPANKSIKLLTWNIGYAGMGKESDFIMDMGKQKRPLSKNLVIRNMQKILHFLADKSPDIAFLQEVAEPSWVTYQQDNLLQLINKLSHSYEYTYKADIKTSLIPKPFRFAIGNATFSKWKMRNAEARGLPLEPNFSYGMFRKNYRMHITRLIQGDNIKWVFINIHLSAFDDKRHEVREKQLSKVLEFAQSEYNKGNHVVVAGDWNLKLTKASFSHTTNEEFLFWVRDLPYGKIPKGWTWGIDHNVPTVRTAHKPYQENHNYTTIIDGFLCSPNVHIESTSTSDLKFEFTDHHPVQVIVQAKSK
jgi:endonuclease/exonuclease/phosphatase family metal-dependent hydrolase